MKKALNIGIVFAFTAVAAFAQTVKVDLDKEKDFNQYFTYSWKGCEGEVTETGVENSLVHRRIRTAVDGEMTAKGMLEVAERPDLYLLCAVDGRERVQYESTGIRPRGYYGRYGWYGPGPYWGISWSPAWTTVRPNHYLEGQMSIMMVDAETDELVWRAIATSTLTQTERDAKKIDKAAKKAFKKFPVS